LINIGRREIVYLHLEEPRLTGGIVIDQRGVINQGVIDLDNLTIKRGQDVRGGFDRFNNHHLITLRGCSLKLWQFYENHITQLSGRVFGDADHNQITIDQQPFMFFCETHLDVSLSYRL
jgi:hypothetical protein